MMNKQTAIAFTLILVIALGALWLTSPFSDPVSGGQAIAAESEEAGADSSKDGSSKNETAENTPPAEPWSVRCSEQEVAETGEKIKHCEVVQRIVETKSKQLFSEVAIGYPTDSGEARGVIILPLGTLLEPGVKMQIDEGRVYNFDFRYCVSAKITGCVAVVKLTPGIIDEMKMGGQAKISFMNVKGRNMVLPITLKGFTKAIEQVDKG